MADSKLAASRKPRRFEKNFCVSARPSLALPSRARECGAPRHMPASCLSHLASETCFITLPCHVFSLVTVKVWLSTAQVFRRRVTELVLDLHKNSLPRCLVCAWSQTYVDLVTWLLQDALNSFELADEKRERAAAGQGLARLSMDPRRRTQH